jgi:hypothetical protein
MRYYLITTVLLLVSLAIGYVVFGDESNINTKVPAGVEQGIRIQ